MPATARREPNLQKPHESCTYRQGQCKAREVPGMENLALPSSRRIDDRVYPYSSLPRTLARTWRPSSWFNATIRTARLRGLSGGEIPGFTQEFLEFGSTDSRQADKDGRMRRVMIRDVVDLGMF